MMSEEEIKKIFKEFGLLKDEEKKSFLIENIQYRKSPTNNFMYSTDSNTNKEEDENNAKLE